MCTETSHIVPHNLRGNDIKEEIKDTKGVSRVLMANNVDFIMFRLCCVVVICYVCWSSLGKGEIS